MKIKKINKNLNGLVIGMSVIVNGHQDINDFRNDFGKIVNFLPYPPEVGVEFNRVLNEGHNCNGTGKQGYCYYVNKNMVVADFEGVEYDPEDLYEDEEIKIGDVVLVNNGKNLIDVVGKIYQVNGGQIIVEFFDIVQNGYNCHKDGTFSMCSQINENDIVKYLSEKDIIPTENYKRIKNMKVGDIVLVNIPAYPENKPAKIVDLDGGQLGVQFDEFKPGLHNCNGKGLQGCCYYINYGNIIKFLKKSDYNEAKLKDVQKRLNAIKNIKVGDHVIVNGQNDAIFFDNEEGKVVVANPYGGNIGVEFFRKIRGHNCGGKGKNGYCYNIYPTNIVSIIKKEEIKQDRENRKNKKKGAI